MGDENSDNWTRHINQNGLALWETDAIAGRIPDAELVQPEPEIPPIRPVVVERDHQHQERSFIQPPLSQLYRARVARLEQEQQQLCEAVDEMSLVVEQTEGQLREQELRLQMLQEALWHQKEQLVFKRDEQRRQQQELAAARRQMEEEQKKQRLYEERAERERRIRQESQYRVQHPLTPTVPVYDDQRYSAPASPVGGNSGEGRLSRNGARMQPLAADFQPPEWCFQVLLQQNGIPLEYAQAQLDDFKMYWLSTGEARKAWEYRFVKHVVFQWKRERGQQSEGRTVRRQPTTEELTDTSWADKYDFDFD